MVVWFQPVWVKCAGVPTQAHVALHLQSPVLFLPTDVFPLQLVLSLHHAPQHLTMDTSYILFITAFCTSHIEICKGTILTICCSAVLIDILLTLNLNSST